ncbi:MAG: pentapeptide repeat-containing protein [Caldilineaceae bacterium]|nr:pentapeptide repeat-containing protein [Caldilineaceae bacterium]
MADQNHINWWHEGVKAWNVRRASSDFEPNFSGLKLSWEANFQGFNLERANFMNAKLVGANFKDANLANANLRNIVAPIARFDNAIVGGADLQQASLTGADFNNAILQKANLTDADLTWANLSDADLRFAVVAGARLETAILSRTNTLCAKLWEATLYEENEDSTNLLSQNDEIVIQSVADLLNEIHKIDIGTPLYFRGEQRYGWHPKSSIFREDLSDVEDKMLVDLLARRPQEMNSADTALEQLQIAQHYGLKTRLLDVTKNPLVALFFACKKDGQHDRENGGLHIFSFPKPLIKSFNSDTVSVIANFAKLSPIDKHWLLSREGLHPQRPFSMQYNFDAIMARLYQKIREEKPYFEERIDMKDLYGVFVVEPQQKDERIRAQSSAFLVSAYREQFDYEPTVEWSDSVRPYGHYTLSVAHEKKEHILNDLKLLEITQQTLFPGLESAAAEVMNHYSL